MSKARIFGYARVSSTDQNLDRQIERLKKYVPMDYILTDKESGKDINRPAYQALKGALGLRKGDILYIVSLAGTKNISNRNYSGFRIMEYV